MPQYTVQLTAPAGNYPFSLVTVSLFCAGQPQQNCDLRFQPNALVQQHVFNIANGIWRLRVSGRGFVPIDQQNINVNANAVNAQNLTVLYYTLHTDRDRDGNLDGPGQLNQKTPNAISFGAQGRGAIIPVNCNRQGNNAGIGYTDNQDQNINGNIDLAHDVAQIEIRRNIVGPPAGVPGNWGLRLKLDKATDDDDDAVRHFRIFDGVAHNSAELIGPQTVQEVAVTTNSVGNARTLGIEAIRFAGHNFPSGQAVLTLFTIQPEVTGAGNPTYFYSERLAVARWIGSHHRQAVSWLYVADAPNVTPDPANPDNPDPDPNIANFWTNLGANATNNAFRTALGNAAAADNPVIQVNTADPVHTAATRNYFLQGNNWVSYAPEDRYDDRWLRDTMISGFSKWPGAAGAAELQNVFMKTHRCRPLQNWVYRTLLDLPALVNPGNPPHPKVGVYYPAASDPDDPVSANSGGNFGVTPPVQKTVNGATTNYLYGRIYYGHSTAHQNSHQVDPSSREFLSAQNIQAPIHLDTDWLVVGHVDGMMTFVPDEGQADQFKKWKLLVASPKAAYDILTANNQAHGNARMLQRPAWNAVGNTFNYTNLNLANSQWNAIAGQREEVGVAVNATIADFLGNGQAPLHNPRRDKQQVIRYTYQDLRNWNLNGVETVIERNITKLKNAFDLSEQDIIRVPVIFYPDGFLRGNFTFGDKISPWTPGRNEGFNVFPGKQGGFQCGALTADMPNMFVGNDRLIVPKPFGPWVEAPGHDNDPNKTNEDNNGYDLFERDLVTKLQQAGINLRCIFIDDWYDYHVVSGEIHCGTNELRAQFNGQAAFGNARYANWWTAVNA